MDMTKTWESAFLEKILAGIDMAAFDPKDTEKFYLREMRELRTRADAVINTHYKSQGYMPVDLMVDIINQIKPTSGQKVAAFDRISALMLKMVGCDVTLFDTGAGFVNSGMKFDIVIGNPPYQNNKNKHFYKQFLAKSLSTCNDGGFISLITPITWMKNDCSLFKKYMTETDITYINADAGNYFKIGLGSRVQYFIACKSLAISKKLTFAINGSSKIIDKTTEDFTILDKDVAGIDIVNKIYKNGSYSLIRGKGQNDFKKVPTKDFKYEVFLSSASDRKCVFAENMPKDYGKNKLIVSNILMPGKFDHYGEISKKGVGRYSVYFVEDLKILAGIRKFYNSKLYFFIDKMKRHGRYAYLAVPKLPNSFEDDELYAHFGLTVDEIALVEASAK